GQHGVQGAVAGRAAGAVGAGEEVRLALGQTTGGDEQFFMPGFGLRREELEAVAAFLGHGMSPLKRRSGRASQRLGRPAKAISTGSYPACTDLPRSRRYTRPAAGSAG